MKSNFSLATMFDYLWRHTKRHASRLKTYLTARKLELRGTEMEAFGDGPRHPLP